MRLLAIGNSHVRTLKAGFDHSPKHPFRVDYVGYWANQPFHLDGSRLIAPATGQFTTTISTMKQEQGGVELHQFDAIIISAAGSYAVRNHYDRAYCHHVLFDVALPNWALRADAGLRKPAIVSSEVFHVLVRGMFAIGSMNRLIMDLPKAFRGRIIVQPVPLPSELVAEPGWKMMALYGERWGEVLSHYYKVQYRLLEEDVAASGGNIELLPCPEMEWLDCGFYPAVYGAKDPWHGNDKYGALVVNQIAASLI